MTRIVFTALVAFALLWSTFSAQQPVANAITIGGVGVITTNYYPTCALYGGDDNCLKVPTFKCPMTDVGASVATESNGGLAHHYDYRLIEPCKNVHVRGSYSVSTGDLQETVEGSDWRIRVLWNCESDPWIGPAPDQWPRCSRSSLSSRGDVVVSTLYPVEGVNFPVSVVPLEEISRQTLNGQLQNAIKQSQQSTTTRPTATPTPVPAPPAPPLLTLQLSSTGAGVEAVQYLLRHRGADVQVDGNFGDQTVGAVRDFQQANGLPVNGIVNEKTWQALWVTVQSGDTDSDAVRAAQTLLNRFNKNLDVDGDYEDLTEAAVRAFQQQKGLPVNGIVGPETWRALSVAVAGLGVHPSQ
jgi:peptidoglycan hydrolase-like protein with peptidoglycan-binding domain